MEMDYYDLLAKSFANDAPAVGTAGVLTAEKLLGNTKMTEGGWRDLMAQGAQIAKAMSFNEGMFMEYKDGIKRASMVRGIKSFVAERMKLGTTDIGSLLLTTISPRYSFLRNEETPILNLTEAATGPDLIVDDWMYRIAERRQGNGRRAARVNPEAALVTTSVNSVRSQKTNTLGFWGDPVSVEFVATAQAGQQTGIDLLRQEMDSEAIAIRQAINYDIWNGQEQRSFSPNNVPQIGGILSRELTNTDNAGGLGFSTALIETANNALAVYTGYDVQRAIFASPTNVGNTRTIEIARYGGANQVSYMRWEAAMGAKLKDDYKLVPDRIYEPNMGPPIPVFHDLQMAANTAVMLTMAPDYVPRMAYFRIGGVVGPWMFVRPVFDLKETVFCMHGGTLDDPLAETYYSWTNTL